MDLKIQINSLMLMLPSYRNQSVYLQSKSIDQFLCNGATLAFIEFSQMLNEHYNLLCINYDNFKPKMYLRVNAKP